MDLLKSLEREHCQKYFTTGEQDLTLKEEANAGNIDVLRDYYLHVLQG
jgi:hypothetical protein